MKDHTYTIETEEEYVKVLGRNKYDELENYGYFFDLAIVVEGNVELDISFMEYVNTSLKKAEIGFVSVIFTGNLILNNMLELDKIQLIVLGKTVCPSFVETSYHFFYGENVKIENYGVFVMTSGCISFKNLKVPVLIVSANFPRIENLIGNTKIFSDNECFINSFNEKNISVYNPENPDVFNSNFLKQFDIGEDEGEVYGLNEVFEYQKDEIIKYLDSSTDIIATDNKM